MERKWWHGKTAMQIYPKSYRDANGDGIGDLRGILEKLDYLHELGIGLLWLSPIYPSPLADQGYDISDYYNIDPRFGTLDEMDEFIREAKKRDIGIVMDLVVNHCSDEHEWFRKACADPDGPYGKYFYIEDWHEGEPLPCNWRSYFGGPVWSKLPGHEDKAYLHLFHRKQPDLNWENPEVRREIYKMVNWWLDRGLAGFRIDAIINIKKALPFRDYPADRPDGLCRADAMLDDARGVLDFLDELADETFRKRDAFTVGEVFNAKEEELPRFLGDDGCFSTMFDFDTHVLGADQRGWYAAKPVTAEQYKRTVFASQRKAVDGGWYLCNIIENHDEPRGVSRYLPPAARTNPAAKKMLGGLNFFLRGLPFLYQGQEIGMENTHIDRIDEADDVAALDQYQVALDAGVSGEKALEAVNRYSRDNARTPFQWDDTENAGFTSGTPWLPVNRNYPRVNLASQREDPDSVWNFYRAMIRLRSDPAWRETVVYGRTIPFREKRKNLMAYYRHGERTLLVLGNYQGRAQSVRLPKGALSKGTLSKGTLSKRKLAKRKLAKGVGTVLLNNLPALDLRGDVLYMEPWQFVVMEVRRRG